MGCEGVEVGVEGCGVGWVEEGVGGEVLLLVMLVLLLLEGLWCHVCAVLVEAGVGGEDDLAVELGEGAGELLHEVRVLVGVEVLGEGFVLGWVVDWWAKLVV